MDLKARILVFVLSAVTLLVILRLVQRRRVWERYAVLWVYIGVAILLLPFLVDAFDWVALQFGVDQPPNLLFVISIVGILLLLLQFTVEITTLVRRSRNTVQELAILEDRVRRLEEELARAASGGETKP